jgi:uncharacterized protein involved in exopolysaccharide biosynthesis
VTTEYQAEPSVLSISATERHPRAAAKLADTFAREYLLFWRASDVRRLRMARALVEGRLSAMDTAGRRGPGGRLARRRLGELDGLLKLGMTSAGTNLPADVPRQPSSPSPGARAGAGALLGLLLGLALIAVLERRRFPARAPESGRD